MIVIPAIDLEDGRAVQRVRGVRGTGLEGLGTPAECLERWQAAGAARLHVVDLDAAERRGSNRTLLAMLLGRARVPVQVGGGVRGAEDVAELLAAGADRVLLSTSVWEDPVWRREAVRRFGPKVGFALDVREERLTLRGWTREGPPLDDALGAARSAGVGWIVVTEVEREGSGRGVDPTRLGRLRRGFPGELTIAGGVRAPADLRTLEEAGVDGAIVGRALYEGSLPMSVLRGGQG